MLKKFMLPILMIVFMLFGTAVALADDSDPDADYPWQFHDPPFDFKFGNMINSHQQSKLDNNGTLHGFIYIHDTGELTDEGLPIAEKAHCPTQECRVGWLIKGVPITATLVSKGPRIWLVDPADLQVEPGYTHFHWLGEPHSPHDLVIGQEYPGILMKRTAPAPFFWLGGSGSGGSGGSGGCGGEGGGCSGGEGGCTGEEGGCSGGEGGCTGEESGCTGEEGGCTGEEGGCSGEEGGCTGEEGGCSGGGSGGSDPGGCPGGGGGHSGGHTGRIVPEGVDPHSNIVTVWDGSGGGGSCGGCSDGCGED